jgi:acyl carrier protein
MELNDFILKFASQFEDAIPSDFNADTDFKNMEEWNSLMLLSIIAMADEEYDIILKGEDVKNANTINDLFEIVKNKK